SSNILKRAKTEFCNQASSKSAMWYIEKLIWAVVYGIGGGYTIYCGIELIQQYKSGEIYTRVTSMINKSITLPSATICIGQIVVTPTSLNLGSSESGVTESFYFENLTEYFSNSTNDEVFLHEENVWPREVLFMVYQYLSIIQRAETNCEDDHYCTMDKA